MIHPSVAISQFRQPQRGSLAISLGSNICLNKQPKGFLVLLLSASQSAHSSNNPGSPPFPTVAKPILALFTLWLVHLNNVSFSPYLFGDLLLGPHAKQPKVGEPLVYCVPWQVCLLVTILREERLLSDSVIGAMTIAKLVHEEDKVMKSCVFCNRDCFFLHFEHQKELYSPSDL